MHNHPWFKVYQRNFTISPGIIVGKDSIPIDDAIVKQMQVYGYDDQTVYESLDANR